MSQVSCTGDIEHVVEPARAHIELRLATLRSEYGKGEIEVQRVQARLSELQQTMLRLSGAIVVLEELLAVLGANDTDPLSAAARFVQAQLNTVPDTAAAG